MLAATDIAVIGTLLGDQTRATIVAALLDGRALTARELAHGAGVTPQTASFHLSKLDGAGLLDILPQGRHHFYRLASPDIADAIEALAGIAPSTKAKPAAKRKDDICFARTCYGHLAGYVGMALTEALREHDVIKPVGDDDFLVSPTGRHFFRDLDIDLVEIRKGRRLFARQCLDWSERKPHLGGSLGQAMTDTLVNKGWLRKRPNSREVHVTDTGHRGIKKLLGVDVKALQRAFLT
ncbi:MAG: ArsR family transcriptional regulator [Gammaproteobacteria bacterium]|nr:ArsR family transcriptional regulator [Gammaproteobacteria bacterium]